MTLGCHVSCFMLCWSRSRLHVLVPCLVVRNVALSIGALQSTSAHFSRPDGNQSINQLIDDLNRSIMLIAFVVMLIYIIYTWYIRSSKFVFFCSTEYGRVELAFFCGHTCAIPLESTASFYSSPWSCVFLYFLVVLFPWM